MSQEQEHLIWSSNPSHLIGFTSYLIYTIVLIGLLITSLLMENINYTIIASIPAVLIIWNFLVIKNVFYKLTTQRIKLSNGVLNKKMEELELYRVKDYKMEKPFLLRFLSLSNIAIETSDRSNPIVIFKAVKNGEDIMEKIRNHVEKCKKARGIREVDVYAQ